jgi:hypothetical protein
MSRRHAGQEIEGPGMSLLTICMPSKRNLEGSRPSIDSAYAFCKARGAVAVVADNSGDPEKAAYLATLAPFVIRVESTAPDATANFTFAIGQATTPFVLPMGDDDFLYALDTAEPYNLAELPADCIGVRPMTEVFIPGKGTIRRKEYAINASKPGARIHEYLGVAGGDNSAFYSIFRREPYLRLFQLFDSSHPTRGGYCDWSQVEAMFSSGKMAYDPSILFRYNFHQWSTPELVKEAEKKLFVDAGLGENYKQYLGLVRYLDTFILVARASSPLGPQLALETAKETVTGYLRGYAKQVAEHSESYDPEVRYLCELAMKSSDEMEIFQFALLMVERLRPGLKDGYIHFFRQAMVR